MINKKEIIINEKGRPLKVIVNVSGKIQFELIKNVVKTSILINGKVIEIESHHVEDFSVEEIVQILSINSKRQLEKYLAEIKKDAEYTLVIGR